MVSLSTEYIEIYSDVSWDSIYRTKQELSGDFSDILFGLKKGEVFGPYKDGNTFRISRMICHSFRNLAEILRNSNTVYTV